jgi:hypothetical protein
VIEPALALVVALGFFTPPGALVRFPDAAALIAAADSHDDVELERVAARLGAPRLQQLAERGERQARYAALRALPLVDDGWSALPSLPPLFSDGDGEIAAQAAQAARRIAEGMTPELYDHDLPRDVPARAARLLLRAAGDDKLKPELRVQALEATAALRSLTHLDEKAVAALLSDRQPSLRRAAAEALAGASSGLDAALGKALASDGDNGVAAAAAATLCRELPIVGGAKPGALEQRIAKLPGTARTRLRALALDDKVALSDRLDLIACLRVAMQPDDQKTLDTLARRPPESLRRRALSLGGR